MGDSIFQVVVAVGFFYYALEKAVVVIGQVRAKDESFAPDFVGEPFEVPGGVPSIGVLYDFEPDIVVLCQIFCSPGAGVYDKLGVWKCSGGAVHQVVVPVQVAQSVSRGCDFYHGEDFFFHRGMSGDSDEAQVVHGFFGFVYAEFAESRLDECHAYGKYVWIFFARAGNGFVLFSYVLYSPGDWASHGCGH